MTEIGNLHEIKTAGGKKTAAQWLVLRTHSAEFSTSISCIYRSLIPSFINTVDPTLIIHLTAGPGPAPDAHPRSKPPSYQPLPLHDKNLSTSQCRPSLLHASSHFSRELPAYTCATNRRFRVHLDLYVTTHPLGK